MYVRPVLKKDIHEVVANLVRDWGRWRVVDKLEDADILIRLALSGSAGWGRASIVATIEEASSGDELWQSKKQTGHRTIFHGYTSPYNRAAEGILKQMKRASATWPKERVATTKDGEKDWVATTNDRVATTKDGERVVLRDDGTWKLLAQEEPVSLSAVSKIYVEGNNRTAIELMQRVREGKDDSKGCISTVSSKADADAILEVPESIGGEGIATARLESLDGDLLWLGEDSLDGVKGLAWTRFPLLKGLTQALSCKDRRQRD